MVARAKQSARAMVLLAVGTAVGVALAAAGLLGSSRGLKTTLPADAVATINGVVIRTSDYQRLVAGLANDRRDGIDAAQRALVLDRLIDEELLVQRGLELGLARQDRKVRADLTSAVIAAVVAEQEDVQPTDAELEKFYETHRDFFIQPGRLRLRQIFCRVTAGNEDPGVLDRARQAGERLRAGEDYDAVRNALGDHEVAPLPDALLPAAKLIDYLGPTALQAALALGSGEVSEPVRSNTGYHVLQVIERQADSTPPFADLKPRVLAEFRRRAGEQALRTYLDDLRSRAAISLSPTLP